VDVKISVFRACAGGYVGAGHVHPALLDAAREALAEAKASGTVADGYIARCGDDIDLVLLQSAGRPGAREVAHEVFARAASAGSRLHQHGGNGGVRIEGTELSFVPRPSEPVLCFFTNKVRAGTFNLDAYRIFADPFVTGGLVTDAALRDGFRFVVRTPSGVDDAFDLPDDLYRLLDALRSGGAITEVRARASGEIAAVVSGGRDPSIVMRCESPFPSVEDALESFATRPASIGPQSALVPVSANGDATARAIPRVVGLGFQVMPERLVGPRDLLGDNAFDDVRREAMAVARRTRSAEALVLADEVSSPH
jgi:fructose 1,6-bisphosphate aldolase/phosphatase